MIFLNNFRNPDIGTLKPEIKIDKDIFLSIKHIQNATITTVTDLSSFENMISVLEKEKVLGIDTESKEQELCLIQIASKHDAFLIDLVELTDQIEKTHWKSLSDRILNNEAIEKLGFSLLNDLKLIAKQLNLDFEIESKSFIDLQIIWRNIDNTFKFPFTVETPNKSLANLVKLCTGFKLNKKNQISNWKSRPLRPDQVEYAAIDALCLFEIYEIIKHAHHKQLVNIDIKKKNKNQKHSTKALNNNNEIMCN